MIAAMIGIPTIFMTRVRLYASTCSAISLATCGIVFIRKCVAPMRALIVPKGCATVSHGGAVAQIGKAFDMNVIAWSQNLTAERAAEIGAELVSKEELFGRADVVSVHLVLSGRTRGLVGAHELALMKPTARLVNTSRGPIVVEADLIAALKAQKIAGAAIDVFDQEPLPLDHPFRTLPNLLATPHIGYVSRGLYARFYQDTVENIRRWLDGQATG